MTKETPIFDLKLASTLLILLPSAVFAGGSITPVWPLNGGDSTTVLAISADGSTIAGYADDGAAGDNPSLFRWTQATGMVSLGTLNGGFVYGIKTSADGSVLTGYADDGAADDQWRAIRWTQATGMVSLGTLNGGNSSQANQVSADGSVVVGYSNDGAAGNQIRAFRWTQASGMVSLGTLNGGNSSQALGTNADGSVVVGYSNDASNRAHAFRWTQATGMVSLGTLNGGNSSQATQISADGSVVVGYSNDGAASNKPRAFRWTQATGMVSLGTLNEGNSSLPGAISADGSVVVGTAHDGAAGNQQRAFRWTAATGLQKVEDWLRANGVIVPADITLTANGISADGNIVVGLSADNQSFIACVVPNTPQPSSGLITVANALASLATLHPVSVVATEIGGLTLNGIHGHTLDNRIQKGNSSFWLGGDWGGKQASRDGIAEVGLTHKIVSNWQAGLGVGKTLRRQSLDFNGKQRFKGTYTLAELMGELPIKNLWLTLDTLAHWGSATNTRGYINASTVDSSEGHTNSFSKAFKLRLDQDKLFQFKTLSLTPYAQYGIAFAKQKAYTEIGGSFPAYFNASKQRTREVRIGFNGELPSIWKQLTLVGTVEGVHRFEKTGPENSGGLLGLFNFTVPGKTNKQNWLRGSLGLQSIIGEGILALTLNATTVGEDDRMWVGISYNLNFDTASKFSKKASKTQPEPSLGLF